jgi:hypothetical protein
MGGSTLRLFLCSLLVAGIAGCGGSSGGAPPGGGGGGNPTTVTYTFTGATPTVVAAKIGAGAYTQATLQSGKLTITIPSGTTNYSVAFLCPGYAYDSSSTANSEQVIQASALDGTSFSENCYEAPVDGSDTVQVDAAAIPEASFVQVGDELLPWSSNTIDFSGGLPTGTHDIPILVTNNDILPIAAKILRNQVVPGALNNGDTVDFSATDELVPQSVTYGIFPSGFTAVTLLASYETANGAIITLSYANALGYPAMPLAAYQSGDYYFFYAVTYGAPNPGESVGIEDFTSSGGPQSFTFPAAWSYAGPTAAALPAFSYDYSGFSGMADVSLGADLQWTLGTSVQNIIDVRTSQNYLGGSTSVATPDLSAVPGFLAPAPSGSTVDWVAFITQGNPFLTTTPNGTQEFVQNGGTYTAP